MTFVCAISGEIPNEPVISPKSGSLFEKKLILKHLESSGNIDPVNNEPLSKEDLIEMKISPIVKPKTGMDHSIPGMLKSLQDEYDSICLNNFQLRKQLKAAKQELTNLLYQNQASIEVIARLLKEVKAAKDAYSTLQPSDQVPKKSLKSNDNVNGTATENTKSQSSDLPSGLSEDYKKRLLSKSKSLSAQRGKRNKTISQTSVDIDMISNFSLKSSFLGIHSPSIPGICCVSPITHRDLILTCGKDGFIKVFSIKQDKILSSKQFHSQKIVDITPLSNEKHQGLTSSRDGSVSMFAYSNVIDQYNSKDVERLDDTQIDLIFNYIALKGSPIVGHQLGILEENIILASSSKWSLQNLESQTHIIEGYETLDSSLGSASKPNYTSLRLHPDGAIFGIGTTTGLISIWSLNDGKNACQFEGHKERINSLSFSENGYHLASASDDNTIKLWDLRKLSCFKTIECQVPPKTLTYDSTGCLLAVGSKNSVSIYSTYTWQETCHLVDEEWGTFQDLKFDISNSDTLYTAADDRALRIFY
ncbi:MAG: hypothetical protein MHMPM18_001918 [Marteilia pararefringens]